MNFLNELMIIMATNGTFLIYVYNNLKMKCRAAHIALFFKKKRAAILFTSIVEQSSFNIFFFSLGL